jgi:MFS family permease
MTYTDELNKKLKQASKFLPWLIWLLAVFFYGYEFIQRVSMSVYIPYIMHDLKLDATAAGLLGGSFYYAYALMQLPVGAITDHYGPKYPALFGLGLMILGTFIMSSVHTLELGLVARFLVGIGGAFAFICTMQFIILWFPREKFAGLAGLTNFMGYIGASIGVAPIAILCKMYGWRSTLAFTGFLGIAIFIGIAIFVQRKASHLECDQLPRPEKSALKNLMLTMKKPINWVNGLYCTLTVGPTSAFAALWGVKFLTQSYDITSTNAASALTAVFLGVAVGSPLTGWISDHVGKRRLFLVLSALISSATTLTLILMHHLPLFAIQSLCFVFGFMQSVHVLCFANSRDYNHDHAASAIAFTNMALILGGAILQPLIGLLQDHIGHLFNLVHTHVHQVSALEYALLIIPICQFLAALLAFFSAKDYKIHQGLFPVILSS